MAHSEDQELWEKEKKEIWGKTDEQMKCPPPPTGAGQQGYNRFFGYALRGLHISQASCQKN